MSTNELNILEADAIKVGSAIASAVTTGTGSATLDPIQAQVASKTLDCTVSLGVSKGTAAPKGNVVNDGIRLGEAFAQAFISGNGTATLDAFGFTVAGESIVVNITVAVSAR